MLATHHLLSTPLVASLLATHPNDVPGCPIPPAWEPWWDWAAGDDAPGAEPRWVTVVRYYASVRDSHYYYKSITTLHPSSPGPLLPPASRPPPHLIPAPPTSPRSSAT